ncbi:maltooligosyltrehalose trehalohydrolase [Sphingomonas zeicaulis]|uniref:malto-oligosyltrehalose trehalohydrolase n=1 Tax=Sphingomonas zeicaulis TaxID=1632740 RepID=UPI003D1916E2
MSWGATLIAAERTRFRLWAPALDALVVEIEGQDAVAMAPAGDGWFEAEAPCGAGARYRFRLPDGMAVPDPASRAQQQDVHGWSLVVDPEAYAWRETAWRGRPWRETVIQECHAGVDGGFLGLIDRLPEIAATGFTAIELMPVAAFGGTRNWGYDGVLPYAPAAAYGSPDDLRRLVDAAHAHGLMIFLDVVYNHFGPDGNYLSAYAPDFFRQDISTPWGGAIDFGKEPVARFFIDNALYWLRDFRFDGLRFDAVHAIGDTGFLRRLAAEIRAAIPDRQIHLVLENEHNDAPLLEATYDAQWNDDFHNVMHVLLTDEAHGYYRDFAEEPTAKLVRCLSEGFIYQGQGSPNQKGKPRGSSSGHLPPFRFVSFLQNHDQIGNRAMGERLTVLTEPDRLRAATGLLLLCPQIPLTFAGDETGSTSPFLFFTDFRDDLADAVREGRRGEFSNFPGFTDPELRERIPDPNASATFAASRPQPGADAANWRALYAELLALRRAHIVPGLEDARALGAEAIGDKAVVARWQFPEGVLTLAINLGDRPAAFAAPEAPPLSVIGAGLSGAGIAPASFAAWLV